MKHRRDRRSGLPIENPIVFYSKYAAGIARKLILAGRRWRHLSRLINKVQSDPTAKFYTDNALTPVADEDAEHMGLYTQNEAARTAVERELRVAGVKPKSNGNGQPALTMKSNGNGKATHAGNGQAGSGAERPAADERQPESAPPAA